MVSGAASQEDGQIAHPIAHQTANFEKGKVVTPGRTPDREGACLSPQDLGCLLVVYMNRRIFGVMTKLRRNLGLDRLDLISVWVFHDGALYEIKLGRAT
ncbi:hypothetical protein AYO28_14200 [Pseudomonas putida]|uniref:Uncharacterized protein n=1 Tax=Pseudomonas putida TaxID=303 RepID=A0A177SQN8_PSEPU|nr:hypothetical protein AYO28_14200 [Pseudomonas putida]